jgi:hypothetical protein
MVPVITEPSSDTDVGAPWSKRNSNVIAAWAGDASTAMPATRTATAFFISRLPVRM